MQGVNQQGARTPLYASKYSTTSQTAAIAVGISLPRNIIGQIDADRGDISRSRFLLRIIERVYFKTNLSQDERESFANDYDDIQEIGKQDV
jgi:hypothetical protein